MPSHSIDLSRTTLVLDASVVINLLGSNFGDRVLEAFPGEVRIVGQAFREVRRHPVTGLDATGELLDWKNRRLVAVVSLEPKHQDLFGDLTSQNLAQSLDDGEAATIAYAMTRSDPMVPVIDEKKATKIFRARWPRAVLLDTVRLFQVLVELDLLSVSAARDTVFSALKHARMQVRYEMRAWVVELIGEDLAIQCPSLGIRHLSLGLS